MKKITFHCYYIDNKYFHNIKYKKIFNRVRSNNILPLCYVHIGSNNHKQDMILSLSNLYHEGGDKCILDIFPNERPLPIQILEYTSHDLIRESRNRVYDLDYDFDSNIFKTYSSEVFSTFLRQLGNFDYCNWLNALGIFVEEILVNDGKIIERKDL
jgi:hypothetical protein